MDYTPRAIDQDLLAIPCRCCDHELCADDPAYYDRDESGYVVEHAHCHEYVVKERAEVWLSAANLARFVQEHLLAEVLMERHRAEIQRIKGPSGADVVRALFGEKEEKA